MSTLKKLLFRIKYDISIRTKMIFVFFFLTLTAVIMFAVLSFLSISDSSAEQLVRSAKQAFDQTIDLIEYRTSGIVYASDQLAMNRELNEILISDTEYSVSPKVMEDFSKIKTTLINSFDSTEMNKLNLVLYDFSLFSDNVSSIEPIEKTSLTKISTIADTAWYQKMLNSNEKIVWVLNDIAYKNNTDIPVISCIRRIRDLSNYSNILGVIKIDVLQSEFNKIISRADISTYGASFLINSENEVFSYSNLDIVSKYLHIVTEDFIRNGSAPWTGITYDNAQLIVGYRQIKNTDWTLVTVIPEEDINAAGRTLVNDTFLYMLIVIILSGFLVIIFANRISLRIRKLAAFIDDSCEKHHAIPIHNSGNDEVSVLARSYNYMIDEMDQYSQKQFELGKEIEKSEIKALQAQINPHFLYNTLDIINMIAMEKGAYEICTVVQNLARFYKLSLRGGDDIVTLETELNLIRSYIMLQNLKYENSIHLIINVPESANNILILKMVLQPIVENAVQHGIREKDPPIGTITISATEQENRMILEINDDGAGMSEELINDLYSGKVFSPDHGYGIRNVMRRIQLHYGDDYQLRFKSEIGKGTSVIVQIPTR